ncbi:MAG: Glu/Leu/Phe/Val dehydrogenase [Candidatus Fermentithermobacillus carboniphilus]|uniref:Glu/Leu/Phe/Val dehydrogenase n=1 Tax=Candidatus Fermentithermobacillus carboniphilus TaxID=3085328 RepID=A0AAT9LET2_9FIRM|nr:MAG: Glu/Leu/Phe/Val dehydrogenase [Candidatus Fermentithermobacillus carboniphilus]
MLLRKEAIWLDLFDMMAREGHEQVMFFRDKAKKLKAIIALHDTTLGPALGGTRMFPYKTEEEAILDALRLSKGMTLKSGACGNHFGGGKGIIWGDPDRDKDEGLFRAYGRFIEGLNGRFITGTDVGTYPADFVHCLPETQYVVGLPSEYGGSGDTSVLTAYGVFLGILACVEEVFGRRDLQGMSVAVQGLGKVGKKLCVHLKEAGARLIVADIKDSRAREVSSELGATLVSPSEILEVEADIFSPNAMGGILNEETIPKLNCRIVAGAANNQLANPYDAIRLFQRGILYAPDYIVNAGGVIGVADELEGYNPERARRKVENIPLLLKKVFRISREEGIDTEKAAGRMVEARLREVLQLKGIYVPER